MDPPAFGHGAKGEVWKFHTHFPELLSACVQVLSQTPLFVIVNAYAVSVSALLLQTMLSEYLSQFHGTTVCGELVLQQDNSERLLSTGIFGRWENN
jgi:23S rRNA (cytosine1962-C5)-methyltransferase